MTGNGEELFEAEGYAMMGAAFEVYNHLGHGFLEEVYREALEAELAMREIPFVSKPRLQVFYKQRPLLKHYEADLLIHSEIVVEIKAARTLAPEHEAQLINYLRATGIKVGLLVNFGNPRLEWKRLVC